jgi:hypothetical protein
MLLGIQVILPLDLNDESLSFVTHALTHSMGKAAIIFGISAATFYEDISILLVSIFTILTSSNILSLI